jgi:hypothetical protein
VPLACSLASLETARIECIVEAVALIENTLIREGVENACSLASLETARIECIVGAAVWCVLNREHINKRRRREHINGGCSSLMCSLMCSHR